jgi:hypothetical protein
MPIPAYSRWKTFGVRSNGSESDDSGSRLAGLQDWSTASPGGLAAGRLGDRSGQSDRSRSKNERYFCSATRRSSVEI